MTMRRNLLAAASAVLAVVATSAAASADAATAPVPATPRSASVGGLALAEPAEPAEPGRGLPGAATPSPTATMDDPRVPQICTVYGAPPYFDGWVGITGVSEIRCVIPVQALQLQIWLTKNNQPIETSYQVDSVGAGDSIALSTVPVLCETGSWVTHIAGSVRSPDGVDHRGDFQTAATQMVC